MSHIIHPDEHARRLAATRRRLAELLDPQTEQEREVVARVVDRLDLDSLMVLAELVEYRRSR